jgi:hypothetical protein
VRKFRRAAAVALVAGTGLAAVTGVGSAAASPAHHQYVVTTLPGGYVAPLQFAVDGRRIAVADSFASALYLVGHAAPIATGFPATQTEEESGDLAGVDITNGSIAYTTTRADHTKTLLVVLRHGRKVLQADLGKYEQRANPDRAVTYGPTSTVSTTCKAQLDAIGAPSAAYTGQKDSHPYAVAGLPGGSWLVADAGGNDLLRVDRHGRVSTVAVFPAQPLTITPQIAAAEGLSDCVGVTYRFESVPTDVEVAHGRVYVSTLSGSEADGRVYTVGWNGNLTQLAGGIPAATNIAVTPSGRVHVVELGTGIFSLTAHGLQEDVALPNAAAVEWANGRLYASTAPVAASEGKDTAPGHVVILR